MTVAHGDAVAAGTDHQLPAQYFFRLGLDLLLLPLDERNDIILDIEILSAAPGARYRLHGHDMHRFHAEMVDEGFEGQGKAGGGAVWNGDDLPLGGLLMQQLEMGGIHFGDEEGDALLHAVGTGIGDY